MNSDYSTSRNYPRHRVQPAKAKAVQRENAVVENLPVLLVTTAVVVVVNVLVVVRLLWGSIVG